MNDRFKLGKPEPLRTPVEPASGGSIECQDRGEGHGQPVGLGESNGQQTKRDLRWSRSEKAIARKACDAALKQELQELMNETKRRADRMKKPSEVWDLEHLLTERRKDIDCKYDSRYSHLTEVLGRLLHEKRLPEENLRG